jgi:hypothetical protein
MTNRAVCVHNVRCIVLAKPRLGIGLLAKSLDQSLGGLNLRPPQLRSRALVAVHSAAADEQDFNHAINCF